MPDPTDEEESKSPMVMQRRIRWNRRWNPTNQTPPQSLPTPPPTDFPTFEFQPGTATFPALLLSGSQLSLLSASNNAVAAAVNGEKDVFLVMYYSETRQKKIG